jgi:hypothetical protein
LTNFEGKGAANQRTESISPKDVEKYKKQLKGARKSEGIKKGKKMEKVETSTIIEPEAKY